MSLSILCPQMHSTQINRSILRERKEHKLREVCGRGGRQCLLIAQCSFMETSNKVCISAHTHARIYIVVVLVIRLNCSPWGSSVQFSCSVMSDSLRPHGLQNTRPPCPSPTPGAYSIPSIESVMPSNHLILCRPLLLPPSILPSIMVISKETVLHIKWPKYWSFSFSISPSNEY